MGRIPDHTIREIRDRVDIVDLIGRYIELKRAGRNFKGLCPFHNEKTPSFNVNPDRQIFHCFGCGEGGDVIGFVIRHENLTFPEAARSLARECGIEIPESGPGDRGETERALAALEVAQGLYRRALDSDEGAPAREYLERRRLDAESVQRFEIGYAPDRWDAVAGALQKAGMSSELGERAGLLIERKGGRGHYDRLRGRLVFPIADVRGRVVAFGGRALAPDQEPKYLNTPETPLFRKREAFYGLHLALEPIRRAGRAIVCEGYFDRIALDRAGMAEAVATCGTALTPEHGRQLRRRTRDVVLLFDGDAAGHKATERALEVLLPAGLRVKVASLPAGLDPDDVLTADGPEALRALVDAAEDAIDVVVRRALADGCRTPAEKADAVGRVAPLVAQVADAVERAEHVRRLAVAADTDARAVESVVRSSLAGRDPARAARDVVEHAVPRRTDEEGAERQLRQIASLLLHEPDASSGELRDRLDELLPAGPWKSLILCLCDAAIDGELVSGGGPELLRLEDRLDTASREHLRGVAFDAPPSREDTPTSDVIADLLDWFARRQRAAERRDLTRRLQDPAADTAALLMEKQRQLEQKRAALGIESRTAR